MTQTISSTWRRLHRYSHKNVTIWEPRCTTLIEADVLNTTLCVPRELKIESSYQANVLMKFLKIIINSLKWLHRCCCVTYAEQLMTKMPHYFLKRTNGIGYIWWKVMRVPVRQDWKSEMEMIYPKAMDKRWLIQKETKHVSPVSFSFFLARVFPKYKPGFLKSMGSDFFQETACYARWP